MKKTDGLTRAIGILMFAAMLCYMGFAVARRIADDTRTALATEDTFTLSAEMNGLAVRQEQLVLSGEKYIEITASEGQKLSAGEALATAYSSREALERAAELSSIRREIEELQTREQKSAGTAGAGIYSALAALSAAVQTKDMAAAESGSRLLSDMLMEKDAAELPDSYEAALQERCDNLAAASDRESTVISADCAGIFSRSADGFEELDGESMGHITPSELQDYLNQERSGAAGALGRLVSDFRWYYAALMDSADAGALTEGGQVQLCFSRYSAESLEAEVQYISETENGRSAVLFALDEGLGQLLSARKTEAELIFESYEGIRVPRAGLYRYWAGYMAAENAAQLTPGQSVMLIKGAWRTQCTVSEIGESENGADGAECQVVLCWLWDGDNAPAVSEQTAAVADGQGGSFPLRDYYGAESQYDRLCVFTMTGLQAERKKAELVYAGEDFVLLRSSGEDALRAGNEVIIQSESLYDGRVFD